LRWGDTLNGEGAEEMVVLGHWSLALIDLDEHLVLVVLRR
jgi:hypothetical protein